MSAEQYARDNGFVKPSLARVYECLYCGNAVINLSKHRSRCKRHVLPKAAYQEPVKRSWWHP